MPMTVEDLFKLGSLTASINTLPVVPTYLSQYFTVKRQSTTAVVVDEKAGRLSLVPAGDRRGSGTPVANPSRKARTFSTIHLPTTGFVLAEDTQGLRAFDSEDQVKSVAELANDRLQEMKNNLMVTREHLRIGAIMGKIFDADGSTVLEDLFAAFGVVQKTVDVNLDVSTTKVRTKLMEGKRAAEQAIGSSALIRGWKCIASPGYMDALTDHDDVRKDFYGWQASQDRNAGDVRGGFVFGGVEHVEVNVTIGGNSFIPDGEAYMFPDCPGLLIDAIAPANYSETVNTLGMEYYAKAKPMDFDKGFDLEAQSNPLPLNLIPASAIKLTV